MKVLTVVLFSVFHYSYADKDGLPVFVIDDGNATSHWNIQADPFTKVDASYFAAVVTESIKRSGCVVIFLEDQLSTEDVSIKDVLGTPYLNLRRSLNENKAKYLPSVSQPYKIITHLLPPRAQDVFYVGTAEKLNLPERPFNYFYVSFQDASNETRAASLRNHDDIIKEVIKKVQSVKPGPVLGFYTGKKNPVEIEKINFAVKYIVANKELLRSHRALFRLSGVYSATPLRKTRFTEMPEVVAEHWTRRSYSTRMTYADFELRFSFKFTDTEWALNDIVLLEGNQVVGVTTTASSIRAPWGCSYLCSSPLVIRNNRDGSSVVISSYQLQALRNIGDEPEGSYSTFIGTGDANTTRSGDTNSTSGASAQIGAGGRAGDDNFDPSVNCEPFFSIQILTGLFVSMLLLSILGAGIMGLMDCKSNGRYDDPNGKEILSKADLAQS